MWWLATLVTWQCVISATRSQNVVFLPSSSLFGSLFSGRGQLPFCEDTPATPWRGPQNEIQPARNCSFLPTATLKPSDDRNPNRHLDYNLLGCWARPANKADSWPKKTERRNICCFKLLNLDSFARWQEITNAVSLKEMFTCSEFWSTLLAYNESFCLKENVLVFCLKVSYFLGNISKQHSPVKGRSNIGLTEILKENLVQTNVLRETFKQNKTKNIVTYKYNRFPVCLTDGKISQ